MPEVGSISSNASAQLRQNGFGCRLPAPEFYFFGADLGVFNRRFLNLINSGFASSIILDNIGCFITAKTFNAAFE